MTLFAEIYGSKNDSIEFFANTRAGVEVIIDFITCCITDKVRDVHIVVRDVWHKPSGFMAMLLNISARSKWKTTIKVRSREAGTGVAFANFAIWSVSICSALVPVDLQSLDVCDVCGGDPDPLEDFGYCDEPGCVNVGGCKGCHGYEFMPEVFKCVGCVARLALKEVDESVATLSPTNPQFIPTQLEDNFEHIFTSELPGSPGLEFPEEECLDFSALNISAIPVMAVDSPDEDIAPGHNAHPAYASFKERRAAAMQELAHKMEHDEVAEYRASQAAAYDAFCDVVEAQTQARIQNTTLIAEAEQKAHRDAQLCTVAAEKLATETRCSDFEEWVNSNA